MADKDWKGLIQKLLQQQELDYDQAYWAMDQIMTGQTGEICLASFLTALSAKGEAVVEVHGLADAMQDHAEPLPVPTNVLDIVGTGGDGAHTVNVSTMASLVAAAAGVPVVKHGNRAATSACGSADVLEELGVNLELPVPRVASIFNDLQITFCFAPVFHPSMRFAAGIRRELGFPTVFNILGPMTNPARPRAVAVGVSKRASAPLLAGVFASRGVSALVFRSKERGLDELTTVETNEIWMVEDGKVKFFEVDPVSDLGLVPATLEDLQGGAAAHNAAVVREVFAGKTGPIRDAVVLNAAAGLVAYGKLAGTAASEGSFIQRLNRGMDHAREAISTGAATDLLYRWVMATQA